MNLQYFQAIVNHISELNLCCPVDKSWMLFIPYSTVYMFLAMAKMSISLYLEQSKYTKIQEQKSPSIDHNVLEFCCVLLYTDNLSDLYKETSTYHTNVKYQTSISAIIWVILITDAKDCDFRVQGTSKTCKSIKISILKIWPQNNTFSTMYG